MVGICANGPMAVWPRSSTTGGANATADRAALQKDARACKKTRPLHLSVYDADGAHTPSRRTVGGRRTDDAQSDHTVLPGTFRSRPSLRRGSQASRRRHGGAEAIVAHATLASAFSSLPSCSLSEPAPLTAPRNTILLELTVSWSAQLPTASLTLAEGAMPPRTLPTKGEHPLRNPRSRVQIFTEKNSGGVYPAAQRRGCADEPPARAS